MTMLRVVSEQGRFDDRTRERLAEALTAVVLDVEVGADTPAARSGIMVLFDEVAPGRWAVGGRMDDTHVAAGERLLLEARVMDGDWSAERRRLMTEGFYAAIADALELREDRSALWSCWVLFDAVAEGSWGAGGSTISILDLLELGGFSEERGAAIRSAIASRPPDGRP